MRFASCVLAVLLSAVSAAATTNRPVIGIMTQPVSGDPSKAYIAASYIKFVEGAGARAAPIHYHQSSEELEKVFKGVNGVLFPGGGADLGAGSTFFKASKAVYDMVVNANAAGDSVPLWATCLGFEALMILGSDSHDVLTSGFDSWNYPVPLDLAPGVKTSRLFQSAPPALLHTLATENVTMNNHHSGVTVDAFDGNANLQANFALLSTNVDRAGRPFVSTVEHNRFPIFGTQWHPEKNAYEWAPDYDIPHSPSAVLVTQWVANAFIDAARGNNHTFGTEADTTKMLIYNTPPTFTELQGSEFQQEYIFDVPAGAQEEPRQALRATQLP